MTPKEKAKELVDKFRDYSDAHKWIQNVAGKEIVLIDTNQQLRNAKQCALIAVDEILKEPIIIGQNTYYTLRNVKEFWQEVKREIQAL